MKGLSVQSHRADARLTVSTQGSWLRARAHAESIRLCAIKEIFRLTFDRGSQKNWKQLLLECRSLVFTRE